MHKLKYLWQSNFKKRNNLPTFFLCSICTCTGLFDDKASHAASRYYAKHHADVSHGNGWIHKLGVLQEEKYW